MRFTLLFFTWALLASVAAAVTPPNSVIVLVGPAGADTARRTAQGVASGVRRALATPGSSVELRRVGSLDAVLFDPGMPAKQMELAVTAAVAEAGDATPAVVVSSLDASAQALVRRPGRRLLVAVLESQPLASDAEKTLTELIDYCRDHAVRVLIVDQAKAGSKAPVTLFQKLAEGSGGAVIRDPKAIGSELTEISMAPSSGQTNESSQPPPAIAAVLPPLPSDFPVYVRFLRTTPMRAMSWGTERSYSSFGGPSGGGIATTEGGPNVEGVSGPTRGLLLVESPIANLQFDVDDNAGTFLAKARVTQMVRDSGGREVWRASKDVVIKGPLDKRAARRAGNLYYMREVQLPGGKYSLEATVEDLLAHKTGGVREPLRTSRGLPGFNVSDAVFVRPFKGAADRLEADQIFSYDGDALAPLLAPNFQPGTPETLQVYFEIYPDLRGGQPEVSLEILQRGRVVGRKTLPFSDSINDSSREGRGAVRGEQKHQFPYLATIRGVKLTAGDFEARITVRQDRNVLVRSVPFRAGGGSGPPIDLVVPGSATASSQPPHGPSEEDFSAIVLPEIDPVDLNTSGPALPAEDQARLWEETALKARDFSDRLPNFRCNQETRRLVSPAKEPVQFKERDVIIDTLTYEDGKESYRTIEINGVKTDRERRASDGVNSRGEFGTMLRGIFSPEVSASYKWAGRAMAGGGLCRVFDVDVPTDRSNFVLASGTVQEVAGYHARVFIDEESGFVRRITLQGQGLPKKFALQSPALSLDYGLVRIGEQDYLLPLRSVLQLRKGKSLVRNEVVFRDYHKFEASSQIKFQP